MASCLPRITIDRKELLRFFDEKPEGSKGQATSIVGVVGEDLNAACFQHYLESRGATVCVRNQSVTTGEQKGPRLDRWIDVTCSDESRIVFQTEIKNWSAHAIGGKTLSISASPSEVRDYKQARWKHHWDTEGRTLKDSNTAKVLVRMQSPQGIDEEVIRPLLIFWEAIGPRDKANDHLFCIKEPSYDFPLELRDKWSVSDRFAELWVFSVSSYLRSLEDPSIKLCMPNAVRRLQLLGNLFTVDT